MLIRKCIAQFAHSLGILKLIVSFRQRYPSITDFAKKYFIDLLPTCFSQICARFLLWPHRAIKITRSTEVEEERNMVETRHSRIFMTGNMSKSIKYCGNQFDVATLRLYRSQRGRGIRLDSTWPGDWFLGKRIYLLPPRTQGYKTYANVLVRCDACCCCFWHHRGGCIVRGRRRGMHRQVSDKNEKRYVNFVGTDVKIKPFIWILLFCPDCRPPSPRRDGKYMTLWAKLEIYLFTHGFGAARIVSERIGVRPARCGYLKVMKIYNMAERAHLLEPRDRQPPLIDWQVAVWYYFLFCFSRFLFSVFLLFSPIG